MSALLSIQNMTHYFGGLRAVSDFSFDVPKGVIYGLIGPNGSGKTTTFNLITGIYTPTQGKVFFEGKDITGAKPFKIVRGGIARTFQNLRIFSSLTALDNIKVAKHFNSRTGLAGSILRLPGFMREEREIRDESKALLDLMHLSHRSSEKAKNLPYGELRRLEIARALATRPRLLLLDEPAAGMNPQESDDLARFIQNIKKQFDLSVFLIEHHMDLVMDISDRVYVIDFGRMIASGTPAEVQDNPDVITAYLGVDEE